ncbi:MAG: TetR/AcrR family transcriptional regulator [Muribaculaceae bacterium]|nr:TetR/AcrR family transcriptional regulator [Muribaculaceae bacterium]
MQIMIENGLKGTTMDLVAARLRISKRTLYEIFESKIDMLTAALDYVSRERTAEFEAVIKSADNILEAILTIFDLHQKDLALINVNFFRDMDRLYSMMRHRYDSQRRIREEYTRKIFMIGVEQGYFRNDLNYKILCRTLEIQMESLKRMEELFPDDTSLVDIYKTITLTFLRGIVTPKGQEILDKHYTDENKIK